MERKRQVHAKEVAIKEDSLEYIVSALIEITLKQSAETVCTRASLFELALLTASH
jgi:hypothetical protein